MLEQLVSKILTILNQIPFLLPWIGGRQCMVLRLWKAVELFCSPLRNIFPRISLHDLPYHRIMRKCLRLIPQSQAAFLSLQQKFCNQIYFCNCPQNPGLFDILVEYNPKKRDQRMMSVLPNQRLPQVLSTLDRCSVSFQPVLYRPHTQTRRESLFSVSE